MNDDRTRFWVDTGKWPRDAPAYVFLARAVHQVGRAMFQDEWNGREPVTPEPYSLMFGTLPNGTLVPLPISMAKPFHKEQVHYLLRKHRPDFGRGLIEHGPMGRKPLEFTQEEWTAGLQIASQIDAERLTLRARYFKVIAVLGTGLAEGHLISALRPIAGGNMSAPLDPNAWNTERAGARYFWCQMDPGDPFGAAVGGDRYQYIFLARTSLDRFTESIGKNESTLRDDNSAKPPQTAMQAGIEEAIRTLWPNGIPKAMMSKERETAIQKQVKGATGRVPSARSIQRFLRTPKQGPSG
jgi:hypothetical protein